MDNVHDVNVSDQPTDRLTRIINTMLEAGQHHPEHQDGDALIILADSDKHERGAMAHDGFTGDQTVLAAMLAHVEWYAKLAGFHFHTAMVEVVHMPDPDLN